MNPKPSSQVAPNPLLGETRGRLLTELCGHPQTAIELAARVGTTSNAVRVHLDALRKGGLVSFAVERRGVGKPTHVYALTEAAEYVLSTGYAPALRAVLARLQVDIDGRLAEWLRSAGRSLAAEHQSATGGGDEVDSALDLLRGLGAVASIERDGDAQVVRSACCPLGAVTRSVPEICKLLEGALGAALPSRRVRERCERGEHPRCAFVIE